jgi:hypothetical protein
MLEEYQMFITCLAAREKDPIFEELEGILMQEEERRNNLSQISQSFDLALMAKGKLSSIGKSWERNKEKKPSYGNSPYGKLPYVNPQQGMTPPKFDANVKRNDVCSYYGKFGHYFRDCFRIKYHEFKHRNKMHNGHFVDGGETMNDDLKNIILFILDVALSTKKGDSNAWFGDSGASIHMSCNKH